jgi:cytochrome c556
MTRNRLLAALLVAGIGLAGSAHAAAPDRSIHYRQNVFGLIGWNFGAIADMVRDKRPWDAAEVARRAERIAQLSKLTDEAFPAGSDSGAVTEAKAEIWTDGADFKLKLDDFLREADALAASAKGSDVAAIKAQFGKTGGTCKACHDKYKTD